MKKHSKNRHEPDEIRENPAQNSSDMQNPTSEADMQNPTSEADSARGPEYATPDATSQNASEGPSNSNPPEDPTLGHPAKSGPTAAPTDQPDPRIASLTADLQRTRADFENFRKQTEIQRENAIKSAKLQTVFKLLPLLDDINRGIESYPELAPLAKSIEKTSKELGLTTMDTTPGTEFNPDFHEAVMVDGDGEHEVIAETLRPGYYYDGEVLRPAMVKVERSN